MRKLVNFNEGWYFLRQDTRAASLAHGTAVTLPHTWNNLDGQDGGNDYYRGRCWYAKKFPRPETAEGEQVWLQFDGAAMTAEVYLNGAKLARHEGGYSTFRVELTPWLESENVLHVSVDNSANDTVYPQKADFTFYGGLYRDVKLLIVPTVHFELGCCGTPGIKVTPLVSEDLKTAQVAVETWQNGGNVTITVNGESQTVPSVDGRTQAAFTIENVHLWNGLDDPYLYTATARLDSGDEISVRFGCRKFEIDPQKGFSLNGRSYPLRGISRHQDRRDAGNALSIEHHREDMDIIREIGANTVRLAHYQHAQEFYDLCDENGLIVWAEIPYITQHMPNGRANTLSQMEELVTQCCNHPSIVCWGLSNEITVSGLTDDILENHQLLNDLCHRLDPTRPTAMASAFMLETDSLILDIPDLNSYNLYFGWYLGELEQNDKFFDEFHAKYPDKAIGFSEYGADANPKYQSPHPERSDYTEGYQCVYHEHILKLIEDRLWLWATHVWNLFDFAADGRDEGGEHGVNQKGLVTMDRRLKKDAFYLYKAAWNKTEPFVHLCGRRYIDRAEDVTEIKVYSNQPRVTLYVDGKAVAEQMGKTVFRFTVPISGEHRIEAAAGACRDEMSIRKVDQPNPAYRAAQTGDVVNWFDKEDLKPDCFSIRDTMGALMAHPKAGAIVGRMMEKARASRGDVAQAASGNANLERMMAGMTLESLLKQAAGAIPAEQVKQLNAALQLIQK